MECFDWERSTYETVPDFDDVIMSVDSLVIDESRLEGRDLVRMPENGAIVLISKRLQEIIGQEDIKGILFGAPEEEKIY